jgi:hypothetical protein
MFELSPGASIELLVVTASGAFAAWKGYRRRRAHWSRGSWIGFSLTVVGGLALVGFALAFSVAVDAHELWVGAARSNTREAWIVAAAGCLVGGSLLTAGSLTWFARGEPSRPFSLSGFVERARLHISTEERKQSATRTLPNEDA